MSDFNPKRSGILFIFIGLICLIPLLIDFDRLVNANSVNIVIRYSIPIFVLNGSIGFIVYGILMYKEMIMHYHLSDTNEKKIHSFVVSVIFLPTILTMSLYLYYSSDSIFWRLAWTIFPIYFITTLISGIKILREPWGDRTGK